MLKIRQLGKQGLMTSELGLGCMGMSHAYGTPNDAESIQVIHRALDLGLNLFDTAEMYGPYINEKLIGKALKDRRNQAIIATKFGYDIQDGKNIGLNSHPKHIKTVVDASLKRLDTDVIDILYQHRVDPAIPIEDVVGTMADLITAGKVRFLGLSEAGANIIQRAHKTHPISVLQSEYSLWERNLEDEILPLIRQLGIGLVCYAPLGRGFLTGTAKPATEYAENDFRRQDPRLQTKNFEHNMKIASAIQALAEENHISAAQLALAWLLHQGNDIVPIPGTKKLTRLEENLQAAQVQLSATEIKKLDALLTDHTVSGTRYSTESMQYINR